MKKMLWMLAAAVMVFSTACGVEPSDSNTSTSGRTGSDSEYKSDEYSSDDYRGEYLDDSDEDSWIKKWDWASNACEAFGGSITATGGCYLACYTDDDCPENSECWSGVWGNRYCKSSVSTYGAPSSCVTAYGDSYAGYDADCNLSCDMYYGDTHCPPNFRCVGSTGVEVYGLTYDGFCTGASTSSDGGSSGVCSGCGGIYCSGRCTGCPGCY